MFIRRRSRNLALNTRNIVQKAWRGACAFQQARRFFRDRLIKERGKESMRNYLLKSFSALAACCMVLALAAPGGAQWRVQWGDRSGFGYYSRASVGALIRRAENDSDRFVAVFDRALDDSRLDQTFREERLNQRARDLEQQLNIVRQEFDRGGDFNSIRSEVSTAIDRSQRINTVMRNRRFDYAAERQWWMLRNDLNRLARVFRLPQMGY